MNIKKVFLSIGLIISSPASLSAITPQQAYIAATATIGFIEGISPDEIPHDKRGGIFFALCANHLMTLWMEESSHRGPNANSWLQFILSYWFGEYAGALTKAYLKHYRDNRVAKKLIKITDR